MTELATEIDRFGVVGFNHRQVPARQRGLLAFDDAWCDQLAKSLKNAGLADGVAFVSTCNRQEVVLSAEHPGFALELVRAQLHARLGDQPRPLPEPYRYTGEDAVRHVLRVSASLDSLVVGERQITQQLRRSFDQARKSGWLDKGLNGLAHIAVQNARQIHSRTSIAAESVGVFTLARNLVLQETASGPRPKVAVIGLGEIGLKTARSFASDGRVELTVSSRRPRSPEELGSLLAACRFVPIAEMASLLREMDAIVFATGASRPVLREEALQQALSDQHAAPPSTALEMSGKEPRALSGTRALPVSGMELWQALSEPMAPAARPEALSGPMAPAAHPERSRGRSPLVLVDIGIPPQVEPTCEGVQGTRLFGLDWFTTTGFGQRPQAKQALRQAEAIVDEGVRRVAAWTNVRRYSTLFDSLESLSNAHKQQGIPEALNGELSVLSAEHQRLVADAMHRLLTSYSKGVFQTVTRALSENGQAASEAPSGETDERSDAAHRHPR